MFAKRVAVTSAFDAATQRRVLRYTLGVMIAVLLAAWINWPLAFVAPVFTAKFLLDKSHLHTATLYELLLALIATMAMGLLLSRSITHYPIPLLILVGLVMLWSYYLFSHPKWNLFSTMLLIAVLVLPFMAISNPGISVMLALGLATSGVVAVMVFALMHLVIPEPKQHFAGFAPPAINYLQRWKMAFRAMIVSFPIVCYFFIFQISEALLTMIFIAILCFMITSEKSVKISMFLIFCNALGGVLAVATYSVLAVVPNLIFYTLLIGLMAISIAKRIYSEPQKAPIYATAFSTVLVLIGSTLMSAGDIESNAIIRVGQLVAVSLYMVFVSLFLESRRWKPLSD